MMTKKCLILIIWGYLSMNCCLGLLTDSPCSDLRFASLPYCNATLPARERAHDLVSRLSLSEKASQLIDGAQSIPRLGIPSYDWWSECLHGVYSQCSTISGRCPTSYPMPIGIAAAFDMDQVRAMASQIALEGRRLFLEEAVGIFSIKKVGLDFWAPNINILRDPRWGRGQETPGEDPFLSGEYATAFVKGLQEGNDPRYIQAIATIKHFDAYSMENSTRDNTTRYDFNAIVSDEDLVQTYLPPFKAAVTKGRVKSIMCSYNAVNGIPTCANSFLLKDILIGQWGFDGYTVSDCGAIKGIYEGHKYVPNLIYATVAGLTGGTDLECGHTYLNAKYAVEAGLLQESVVDKALERLFYHRIRLGMFDPFKDQPYMQVPPSIVGSHTHRALSAKIARESFVLLKNTNRALPLSWASDDDANYTIALIGPHINSTEAMCGNYHGSLPHVVSPLEAFQSRSQSSNYQLQYAEGCKISSRSQHDHSFGKAKLIAETSDIVLLFVGIDQTIETEAYDRRNIKLPAIQEQLIYAITSVSNNVVVVLINGGQLDVKSCCKNNDNVTAMLEVFYPSIEGGNAIADVILGDYNPSGRLPYTMYSNDFVHQSSMIDMSMTSGVGRTYRFYKGKPVYPFGYGLSYTTFQYIFSSVSVIINKNKDKNEESHYNKLLYRINVTNTGDILGDVSVLGFISFSSLLSERNGEKKQISCPMKQLFAFQKLHAIHPGASAEVLFVANPLDSFCVQGKNRISPKGMYTVSIGQSSTKLKHRFTLDKNGTIDLVDIIQ